MSSREIEVVPTRVAQAILYIRNHDGIVIDQLRMDKSLFLQVEMSDEDYTAMVKEKPSWMVAACKSAAAAVPLPVNDEGSEEEDDEGPILEAVEEEDDRPVVRDAPGVTSAERDRETQMAGLRRAVQMQQQLVHHNNARLKQGKRIFPVFAVAMAPNTPTTMPKK